VRGSLVAFQALRHRSHRSGRLAAATLGAAALALLGASAAAARTGYVSNMNESYVTPINLTTNAAEAPIEVAPGTAGYTTSIAITPNGKLAYVPTNHKELLTPINLASDTVGAQIPLLIDGQLQVAIEPEGLAITPDGKFVWVAGEESNAISVVEVATNKVVATIPVGCEPEGVAFTPNGQTAYVADKANVENIELPSPPPGSGHKVKCEGTVSVVETATDKVVKTLKTGKEPEKIAITPNGETAYVANGSSGTVTKIDTATNEIVATIKVGEPAKEEGGDGLEPCWIAITPNGQTAYVSNTQEKGVVPIDLATDAVGSVIPVPGAWPAPRGLAITPSGKTLYVAEEEGAAVVPINLATNTAETPIPVAGEPDDVAIVPDQGPTAAFSASTAAPGAASSFNGARSSDLEGKVASYAWSFGDGATTTTSAPTTSHVYAAPGTYTVTLTVTDEEGCSAALVFTGKTAYCNADPAAQTSATITVPTTGRRKAKAGSVRGLARAASSAIVKHGKAQVRLTCTGEGACVGSLRLVASHGKHHRGKHAHNAVIGRNDFSIPKGKRKVVQVPLSKTGVSLLGKAGKHGLEVTVEGSDIAARKLLLKEHKH